jgi:hypothetical protein
MTVRVQAAGTGGRAGPVMTPAPPQTHGLTVFGWVVVCFSVVPLVMGVAGEGERYGLSGLVMAAVGALMVIVGKKLRPIAPR